MNDVLIINDRKDLADLIIRIINDLGGNPVLAQGADSAVLIPQVKAILRKAPGGDPETPIFRGTILDILFQNEPDGGIKLWEALSNEQRNRAGKLIVVTNEDTPEVQAFCVKYAAGRCFAFTNPRLKSIIKFHLF